ncbi:MAG: DMT family transporter [Rhodospirillaceae bacterium]|nr:DMT family transporter [Rhodospirillaceae bacterium]
MAMVEGVRVGAPEPRPGLGTLVIVFSAACFGMVGTMARLAYDGGSNPLTIALLRALAVVAVGGSAVLALRRRFGLPRPALRASLWLAAGTLTVACGFLGSVAFIPVSLSALILYTYPLIVGVLASLSGRESLTAAKAFVLLAAFAGLALALGPTFGALDTRGLGLAALAAIGNAGVVVFAGRALQGRDSLVMNVYTNLWSGLALGLFLFLAGGFALPATSTGWLGAGGTAAFYVGAFLGWFVALRLSSPVRMAVLYNLDAVVNILAGVLILGERLTPLQIAGMLVVLACLVAVAARRGL